MKKRIALLLLSCFTLGFSLILAQDRNKPLEAFQGTNIADNTNGADDWFVYSSQKNCTVKISSCGTSTDDTFVEVFSKGSHETITRNDDYCNLQSEVTFLAYSDSIYLIRWKSIYNSTQFEWILEELELKEGDFYTVAFEAKLGINELTNNDKLDTWYKYHSTDNVIATIKNDKKSCQVYENKLIANKLLGSKSRDVDEISLLFKKDSTYFFKWVSDGTVSSNPIEWNFAVREPLTGEINTLPLNTFSGSYNPVEYINRIPRWFEYKTETASKLFLSAIGERLLSIRTYNKKDLTRTIFNSKNILSHPDSLFYLFESLKDEDYVFCLEGKGQWKVTEVPIISGESPLVPMLVELGDTNLSLEKLNFRWYNFSPKENTSIRLSTVNTTDEDTYICVFNSRLDSIHGSENISETTLQSELEFECYKDSIYYIKVGVRNTSSTLIDISWTLSNTYSTKLDPLELQMTNEVNLFGRSHEWYSYTIKSNCNFEILATGFDHSKQTCYFDVYYLPDTSLIRKYSNRVDFVGKKDQRLLIKCRSEDGLEKISIKIKEEKIDSGSYEFPLYSIEGINQCSHQDNSNLWYIYIPKQNGKIEVTCREQSSEKARVELFSHGSSTESFTFRKAAISCKQGEPVYIKWFGDSILSDYQWSLKEKPSEAGEVLDLALNIQAGIHTNIKTNRMPTFYKYKAGFKGKVEIASCGLSDAVLLYYVTDSSYLKPIAVGHKYKTCSDVSTISFNCDSGNLFFIVFNQLNTNIPYQWSLSESVYRKGENKLSPKRAMPGLNTVDHNINNTSDWFEYTASLDGYATISTCNSNLQYPPSLNIFLLPTNIMMCDNGQITTKLSVKKNNKYLIEWKRNFSNSRLAYDWQLSEAYRTGATIDVAFIATIGANSGGNYLDSIIWFQYKALDNAKTYISFNEHYESTEFDIFYANREPLTKLENDSSSFSKTIVFESVKDSLYYFRLKNMSTLAVDFTLTEYPTAYSNEICAAAQQAEIGINTALYPNNQDEWYKFTATYDGVIIATSDVYSGDYPFFSVYDACPLENNPDFSNITSKSNGTFWNCKAGVTYYMKWMWYGQVKPHDWRLSMCKYGDTKDFPFVADTGINIKSVSDQEIQYFSFSAKRNGFVEIKKSQELNTSHSLSILNKNDDNAKFSYNTDSTIARFYADIDNEYLISWSGAAQASFNWTINDALLPEIKIDDKVLITKDFRDSWVLLKVNKTGYYQLTTNDYEDLMNNLQFHLGTPKASELQPSYSDQNKILFHLQEGDVCFVNWNHRSVANNWFKVEFIGDDYLQTINNAILAKEGKNLTSYNYQYLWYKYIPEKDAVTTISIDTFQRQDHSIYYLQLYDSAFYYKETTPGKDLFFVINDSRTKYDIQFAAKKNNIYYFKWDLELYPNDERLKTKTLIWNISTEKLYVSDSHFRVVPNPNHGIFVVENNEEYSGGILEIFTTEGKLVYQQKVTETGSIQLSIPWIGKGLYILKFKNEKINRSIKFVRL